MRATAGHGPRKVVILGGWFGVAGHWAPFLEAVDEERFECLVFDYRGYGDRRDEAGEFSFVGTAGDVWRAVDALGWSRVTLIGHSMGGMAMQRVALAHPGRVEAMVGIAPVSAAGSGLDETRRAMFASAVNDRARRQALIQFSLGNRTDPAWAARLARDGWSENHPEAMAAYLSQWTGSGFEHEVQRLQTPTLVLVGAHDPGISLAAAQTTWAVHHPHAVIEEVPGTAHYPMQEAPAAVATRVQKFLACIPSPT